MFVQLTGLGEHTTSRKLSARHSPQLCDGEARGQANSQRLQRLRLQVTAPEVQAPEGPRGRRYLIRNNGLHAQVTNDT